MNKKQAKTEAENSTKTYGELLSLVKSTRGKREMSKVNKTFTLDQSLDIFENWLKECDPVLKPDTMKYSVSKGYEMLSGDGLGVWNVLRECG